MSRRDGFVGCARWYGPFMTNMDEPLRGLSMDEQETTVTRTRTGEWTIVETTIPTDISALRNRAREYEEGSGYFGTTAWARFRIPSAQWNPARGIKRTVNLSNEQRAAAAARLRAGREASHD